jgi:hypothetical protein
MQAGEATTDSITAPGAALMAVSPDQLVIDFELITARESFTEAAEAAKQMAAQLQEAPGTSLGVTISVEFDLTLMQQKKWGKGRNLEHRFRMTVDTVPDGKAQETLVTLVDTALDLNPKLTVERYEARLSRGRAKQVRAMLLKQAVHDAWDSASAIAEAAHLRLGSPRSIAVGAGDDHLLGRFYSNVQYFDGGGFARTRPWIVNSDLVSQLRLSVGVVAEFASEAK